MKYLLNSNAWIALLRQKSAPLLTRLQQQPPSDVVLCSVVLGELRYGAWRSGPAKRAANDALIDQLRGRYSSLASGIVRNGPFEAKPRAVKYRGLNRGASPFHAYSQ